VRRIAGLDGLRALAVTGVLLYHGGLAAVPGGFLGVDLFFVISGFLITTLLLNEAATTGRIDVVAFWGRRVRRLLPALALVVASTVVAVALVPSLGGPADVRDDALAAMLYVANWHFLGSGDGYFEQLAAPSPLLHTWSLAIEEQFYVLGPLLLVIALRRKVSRWALTAGATAAVLASAWWMARLADNGASTDRLYYGTDTRAQAILAGVTAALLVTHPVRPTAGRRLGLGRLPAGAVAVPALVGVVLAMVLVGAEDNRLYRGGLTLYAAVGAVLVAAVACAPSSLMTRGLEGRLLRYVGVRSYGLYLWHWPVFLLLTSRMTSLSGPSLLGVRLAVTLLLAIASFRLVEAPLRRSAWQLPIPVALPAGATALACGVLLVIPQPSLGSAQEPTDVALTRIGARPAKSGSQPPDLTSLAQARRNMSSPTTPAADQPHALRVTVLGDSTAKSLAEGLRDIPGRHGVEFHDAAVLGCGVASGSPYRYMGEIDPYKRQRCSSWETRWRRVVASRPVDVVAVLVGRWEVVDQVVGGVWTHVGLPRFDRYVRGELEKAVDAATATGAEVAFLTAPYCSRGEQPDGSGWPEDDPARVDAFNALVRAVAARHPGTAHVIELGGKTAGGGHQYREEVAGVDLRYDGVHFTAEAARWLQPWLVRELARTTRET
jgi:peptidoglycan/LPS O-acetylase OafA/YrhL